MDFVAESVCIVLTLMLRIFFLCYGLGEAMGWASGQLGLVQVVPPAQCVTLSFLICKTGDFSDPFQSWHFKTMSPSPPPKSNPLLLYSWAEPPAGKSACIWTHGTAEEVRAPDRGEIIGVVGKALACVNSGSAPNSPRDAGHTCPQPGCRTAIQVRK